MSEFWHKSERRGRQTVAVWQRFRPEMTVATVDLAAHRTAIARLAPLAQARADRQADARLAKGAETAGFDLIRNINLAVPKLIEGSLVEGHPVRDALRAVYALVPRSDALNLRRARRLIPLWKKANAALAMEGAGAPLTCGGLDVAGFAARVAGYPALVRATAAAEAMLVLARAALRTQHRVVDGTNKRAYKKLAAEARMDPALGAALRAGITREQPGRRPRRA